MINSRNNLGLSRFIALLLGGALITCAPAAVAQEKPKSLVPSFVDGQLEKPILQAPELKDTRDASSDTAPTAPENLPTIVTGDLGAVHPVSINVADDGGLGSDLWRGTDPEYLGRLISSMTPPTESYEGAKLYRQLLQNGGAVSGSTEFADRVLNLRFEKMLAGGLSDDVVSLVARLPARARTAPRRLYEAEAQLINGQGDAACEMADGIETSSEIATFLSHLSIYCHLKAGEYDRADVKYALMEELGDITPFYASLYSRAVGGDVALALENAIWTPLNTAVYTLIPAAKKSSEDIASIKNPAALKQIYLSAKKGDNVSFALLAKLYNAGLISTSDLASKLSVEPVGEGTANRFTRYGAALSAVQKAETGADRAAALITLWAAPENMRDYRLLAALSMPELEKLTGAALSPEFAFAAVKASLLSDRPALAQEWERAARRAVFKGAPETRLQARKIVSRIDMYMLASGAQAIARWTEDSLQDWINAAADDPDQASNASLLVSQMEVLGQVVTEADWQSLLQLPQPLWQVKSNHGLENALVLAATDQQKGAAALLALMIIGETPLDEISLTSLRAVTAGLKAIGQERIARQIALETFIARGV